MTQVKRRKASARKPAATNDRNFRTFLLVSQLEAKEIGARIRLARDEAGLTQEEVAELATFSKRSLQDYEAGNTIPYRHMQEIAGILNRHVPWFLHGDDPEPAPADGLLGEVAANVVELTDSMGEALERLARIEAALGTGGARGTGSSPD